MKKFILPLHFIAAVVMFFVGLPKVLGWGTSIETFNEITRSLPVSSDFFRIFTGLTELFIAFLLIVFLLLSVEKIKISSGLRDYKRFVSIAANGLLFVTMVSALAAEIFARDAPKYILVYLAFGLIIISLVNIYDGFASEKRKQ